MSKKLNPRSYIFIGVLVVIVVIVVIGLFSSSFLGKSRNSQSPGYGGCLNNEVYVNGVCITKQCGNECKADEICDFGMCRKKKVCKPKDLAVVDPACEASIQECIDGEWTCPSDCPTNRPSFARCKPRELKCNSSSAVTTPGEKKKGKWYCPKDCSSHGRLMGGRCSCYTDNTGRPYVGSKCEYSSETTCSSHGIPDTAGKCTCDPGYTGESCHLSDLGTCGGHGKVSATTTLPGYTCECDPDYYGGRCENTYLRDDQCSKHGKKETGLAGKCICDSGYVGSTCQYSNKDCNSHGVPGVAVTTTPEGGIEERLICECDPSYVGEKCDINIPSVCNGHASSVTFNPDGTIKKCDCEGDDGQRGSWVGKYCNFSDSTSCSGGGSVKLNENGDGHVCECNSGREGEKCQCTTTDKPLCPGCNAEGAVCGDKGYKCTPGTRVPSPEELKKCESVLCPSPLSSGESNILGYTIDPITGLIKLNCRQACSNPDTSESVKCNSINKIYSCNPETNHKWDCIDRVNTSGCDPFGGLCLDSQGNPIQSECKGPYEWDGKSNLYEQHCPGTPYSEGYVASSKDLTPDVFKTADSDGRLLGGQARVYTFPGIENIPVYPTINNERCTAGKPPFTETLGGYDKYGALANPPGHLVEELSEEWNFVPYEPKTNFYYTPEKITTSTDTPVECLWDDIDKTVCNRKGGAFTQSCTNSSGKRMDCTSTSGGEVIHRKDGKCNCFSGWVGKDCSVGCLPLDPNPKKGISFELRGKKYSNLFCRDAPNKKPSEWCMRLYPDSSVSVEGIFVPRGTFPLTIKRIGGNISTLYLMSNPESYYLSGAVRGMDQLTVGRLTIEFDDSKTTPGSEIYLNNISWKARNEIKQGESISSDFTVFPNGRYEVEPKFYVNSGVQYSMSVGNKTAVGQWQIVIKKITFTPYGDNPGIADCFNSSSGETDLAY